MSSRVIEVDPERLDRWLAGFTERHGPVESTREDTAAGVVVRARAADGASVVATPFAYDPLGSSSSEGVGMPLGSLSQAC